MRGCVRLFDRFNVKLFATTPKRTIFTVTIAEAQEQRHNVEEERIFIERAIRGAIEAQKMLDGLDPKEFGERVRRKKE